MRHELTASVMTQMDRLLEHLPKNDELAGLDHDTLEIKTDARGNLLVRTGRRGLQDPTRRRMALPGAGRWLKRHRHGV